MSGKPPHRGGKSPVMIHKKPPKVIHANPENSKAVVPRSENIEQNSENVEESTDLNQLNDGADTSSFQFPSLEELDQMFQDPLPEHQNASEYQQHQQGTDTSSFQFPSLEKLDQMFQWVYQQEQDYNQTHQQVNASSPYRFQDDTDLYNSQIQKNASSYQFPGHRQDPKFFQDPSIPFQHPSAIQMQGPLQGTSSSSSQSELPPLPPSYRVEDPSQLQFPPYQRSYMEGSLQGTLLSSQSELSPLLPSHRVEGLSQGSSSSSQFQPYHQSYFRPVYQYPDPNLCTTYNQMPPYPLPVNVPPVSQLGDQHAVPPNHNSGNQRILNGLARNVPRFSQPAHFRDLRFRPTLNEAHENVPRVSQLSNQQAVPPIPNSENPRLPPTSYEAHENVPRVSQSGHQQTVPPIPNSENPRLPPTSQEAREAVQNRATRSAKRTRGEIEKTSNRKTRKR